MKGDSELCLMEESCISIKSSSDLSLNSLTEFNLIPIPASLICEVNDKNVGKDANDKCKKRHFGNKFYLIKSHSQTLSCVL